MANIASGNLTIKLDKNSEFDKNKVDEIIKVLESNPYFTYQGECEVSFYDKTRTLDLTFNGKWNCDSCWEWFENQIINENSSAEISNEAKTSLINSEMSGGSYEHGSRYRDRVFKKSGALKLDRYNHTKLESEWPELIDILDAYNLPIGELKSFDNNVKIILCEKSENGKYLFKIQGDYAGAIFLIDKESEDIEFFSEIDEFTGTESIENILEDLESGDLEQEEDPEDWSETGELIDDLIGENDKFFELIKIK